MKLENVDVSKLKVTDLPKFSQCPCELCDDGCFDRSGEPHSATCARQLLKRTKISKSAYHPQTHYQGTFLAPTSASGASMKDYRRQPCAPAPDNEIPISFKNAPMSNVSSQRQHYQAPPTGTKRQTPAIPTQDTNTLISSRIVPMEGRSHYQAEFVQKSVIPVKAHPLRDSQLYLTEPNGQIASQTTTRTHFKSWHSAPSHPYAEMPAVVGHVLFPGSNRRFETTTGSTFVSYRNVAKIKPAVRLEPSANLEVSGGTMDLQTNYRHDYITPDMDSARNLAAVGDKTVSEPKVYERRRMNGISQTAYDFRAYPKHRPPQAAHLEPFQSQISLGNPFSTLSGQTQYRIDYPGHDANEHPRQPAAIPKDEQKPYITPIEKMETVTVTQRDFQPIDITTLPRIRVIPMKATLSVNDNAGPMESVTMSRHHYKAYEPAATQRRYGELVPNIYIPPSSKFQSSTTTGETYQGRTGPRVQPFNPEVQSIHLVGEHDHRTNYRLDYPSRGVNLCAAKAYSIAQHKETTTTSAPISAQ